MQLPYYRDVEWHFVFSLLFDVYSGTDRTAVVLAASCGVGVAFQTGAEVQCS